MFPYQSSVIKYNHNKASYFETNHFWKTRLTDWVSSNLTYIVYHFISINNGVWNMASDSFCLRKPLWKLASELNWLYSPHQFCISCQGVHNQRKFTRAITCDNIHFQFVIWLKNDKHLLGHDIWRKCQSMWGNTMTSINSI